MTFLNKMLIWRWTNYGKKTTLECGPMPNVTAALSNVGGNAAFG